MILEGPPPAIKQGPMSKFQNLEMITKAILCLEPEMILEELDISEG